MAVIREAIETVIVLLSPIVPHMTEELWEALGFRGSLADVSWPEYVSAIAAEEEITIVIQINGKVRSRITVSADESEDRIKTMALADEKIAKQIAGLKILKEVYVPRKLINIVVKG
jgi:leucyl-tRNA synthetase